MSLRNIRCRCMGHGAPEIIDPCIRELVDCLNRHGIRTLGSCCGHGGPGDVQIDADAIKPHKDGMVIMVTSSKPIAVPFDDHQGERGEWLDEAPGYPFFIR